MRLSFTFSYTCNIRDGILILKRISAFRRIFMFSAHVLSKWLLEYRMSVCLYIRISACMCASLAPNGRSEFILHRGLQENGGKSTTGPNERLFLQPASPLRRIALYFDFSSQQHYRATVDFVSKVS
jgi:hypothetical protein